MEATGTGAERDRASPGARRILCVFPRYAHSFGTFDHAWPLMPGVGAFLPPQGLLTLAAWLPSDWEVRFADENLAPLSERDLAWADAVFLSGMHVQRPELERLARRAREAGRLSVLGGPSVTAAPEYYPGVDVLHMGELGDATEELVRRIGRGTARPERQVRLETRERLPLERFPLPAYQLADLSRYFLSSVQFSSGCPYLCEFCDIPELYGRVPRLKAIPQLVAELDAIVAGGTRGAIYFVDDNFIGHRKAAAALLPHLVQWQRSRGYPVQFACEATLNLAQCPDLLALMREAAFTTVFCGVETPEIGAIRAMRKHQNARQPMLESVRAINAHGIEVVAGIILGLDTDTPETPERVLEFIEASRIPMLTINLLYALPRTPLFRRLAAEGRLDERPGRPSNVRFRLGDEAVLAGWRRCVAEAYEPSRLLARFDDQCRTTYPNRLSPPRRPSLAQLAYGLHLFARVLWHVGLRSEYRRVYWEVCGPLLRSGRIEDLLHIAIVAHHLIRFSQECARGQGEASFYADPNREQGAVRADPQGLADAAGSLRRDPAAEGARR